MQLKILFCHLQGFNELPTNFDKHIKLPLPASSGSTASLHVRTTSESSRMTKDFRKSEYSQDYSMK